MNREERRQTSQLVLKSPYLSIFIIKAPQAGFGYRPDICPLLSSLDFCGSSAFSLCSLSLSSKLLPYCGCLKPSLCLLVFEGLYDLGPRCFSDNLRLFSMLTVFNPHSFFSLPLDNALFRSLYLLPRSLRIFASHLNSLK